MADNGQCSHEICSCPVSDNEAYCSDHCKQAGAQDLTEIKCDCGHDGC